MGSIYARLIIANERSLKDVLDIWKDATIAALEAMVAKGTLSQEKLDEILAAD